jgi:hypothetical protein
MIQKKQKQHTQNWEEVTLLPLMSLWLPLLTKLHIVPPGKGEIVTESIKSGAKKGGFGAERK